MTSPVRPPPKSLDGRSARELFAFERTTNNGEETPPPATSSSTPPVITLPFQTGGSIHTFPSLASGEVDPLWPVLRYDARGANQVRVATNVVVAGASACRLFAQYDGGSGFAIPGVVDVAAGIGAVGPKPLANQGWVDLTPAAIADVLWRLRFAGGDAAASPALWGSHLQFRLKTASRPPLGGGPWGNIVGNWDGLGDMMTALAYADNADVNLWPDESGFANDFGTIESLLLPKWKATGFTGGLPCVQWAGANIPLTTPNNPTEDYGSYTIYFVAENLDGGDIARLWGHTGGDSFQLQFYFTDSHIQVANNNLFGSPSIDVTDDWDMSTKHTYRFVKHAPSSSHSFWVDGVMKASAFGAPQTNNGGLIQLMSDMGGIGCSGRIAEVKAFDQPHISTTPTGPLEDGKTEPELEFSSKWGTP